ncbi:MAG TPA: hypothetical protein VKX49_14905 [Bryobacteraceae bacterium]|nr:hypothetical protein [Bryobacteraceae bacterium]
MTQLFELPHGYHTPVGQRGLTMSKGRQQTIALAQALIGMKPTTKVLILDEFTSALDSPTEKQVLDNLRPLLKDKTVIISRTGWQHCARWLTASSCSMRLVSSKKVITPSF